MKIQRSKNQGMTLIEALIWMAITASFTVMAFVLYSGYRQVQRAEVVSSELTYMFGTMKKMMIITPYTDILDGNLTKPESLKEMGILAPTLKLSSNSTRSSVSQFGLVKMGAISGKPGSFGINYLTIPSGKICNQIVMSQKDTGWASINGVNLANNTKLANFAACDPSNGATVTLKFIEIGYSPTDLNAE